MVDEGGDGEVDGWMEVKGGKKAGMGFAGGETLWSLMLLLCVPVHTFRPSFHEGLARFTC